MDILTKNKTVSTRKKVGQLTTKILGLSNQQHIQDFFVRGKIKRIGFEEKVWPPNPDPHGHASAADQS